MPATRVIAWGNPDKPDLDVTYSEGVGASEMAYIMATYPNVSCSILEPISRAAIDRALASQEDRERCEREAELLDWRERYAAGETAIIPPGTVEVGG